MRRCWIAAVAVTCALAAVLLQLVPAASASAAKLTPRITITLSPSRFVTYDGSLSARVAVSGAKGAAAGEVTVDGLPGGDCEALDLDHGRTNCASDELMSPLGAHAVTVHYSGSSTYRAATKAVHVQVIRASTNADIAESPASSGIAGQPMRFEVDLGDDAGNVPQRGTVAFTTVLGDTYATIAHCGAVPVSRSGIASCTTTLKAGSYTIGFRFTGSPHFAPVSVSTPYVVRAGT